MTTKLLLMGMVVGLALIGMPFEEVSVTGTASAYLCEPTNVQCNVDWAHCLVPDVEDPHVVACPL